MHYQPDLFSILKGSKFMLIYVRKTNWMYMLHTLINKMVHVSPVCDLDKTSLSCGAAAYSFFRNSSLSPFSVVFKKSSDWGVVWITDQFHSPACFSLALVKAGSLMRLISYWKLFSLLVNHWINKQELKLFLSRRDLKSCPKLRRAWIMKPTQDSTALCYFMQDSANSDKFPRKICCIVHFSFSSRDGGSAAKVFHKPEQMSPLAGCLMGRYFE